jgi:hypothetical protein
LAVAQVLSKLPASLQPKEPEESATTHSRLGCAVGVGFLKMQQYMTSRMLIAASASAAKTDFGIILSS